MSLVRNLLGGLRGVHALSLAAVGGRASVHAPGESPVRAFDQMCLDELAAAAIAVDPDLGYDGTWQAEGPSGTTPCG